MGSGPRIPAANITGIRGAIAKRLSRKMLGQVPTPIAIYWHNWPVLRSYFGISAKARKWNACPLDLKSLGHMAIASYLGCTWCLDCGYFQAQNENLDLAKAREVPRWRESDVFTPLERDVLEYAEAMSDTPPSVSEELSGRLLDQLGAKALVELTAFFSMANFMSRTNIALGVESDGIADSCGLPPLATPSDRHDLVGR